jgi:hypothetical protein
MPIMESVNFSKVVYRSSGDAGLLTPALEATGIIADIVVGETVAAEDWLYFSETDKEFKKVLADATTTLPVIAVALEAGVNGGTIKALMYGKIKSQALGAQNRATGTITINGAVADNEYFTLAGKKFVFSTDEVVTAGDIMVSIKDSQTKGAAQTALLAAMAIEPTIVSKFVWGAFVNDVLTLYAKYPTYKGTEGNALTLVKSGTNLAVSAATLASGNDGGWMFPSAASAGAKVYVGPSNPNYVQRAAVGLSADEYWFMPDMYTVAGS